DPIYVVAGSEEFAGLKWIGDPVNGAKNVMTKDGDMYSKTFAATPAGKDYQIKVVKNVANGTNPETGETVWAQTWIGYDNTENNLTFDVTAACDVTVTYNPATNEINVTGDSVKIVKDLKVDYVLPVGNGFQSWLNGEDWKVDAESNKMEMVSDKVYKITFKGVTSSDNYEFKFAANGSWAANWGLPATENSAPVGKDFDLTFNGENMVLDTVALGYAEGSSIDVTLTLDLSGFDYPSKQGAKANITIEGDRLPLLGDADGDFSITVKDATMIQRIAIGLLSTDASKVCDANEDGRISVKDSTIVQKYVVKGYNNTGNVGSPIASAE
ncbi:pullulanase X25 domain-containing protein, partial [Ruminococcus bromii]